MFLFMAVQVSADVFVSSVFDNELTGGMEGLRADVMYAPGTPISEDFVHGPTSPGKWGNPTPGTPALNITWSLMPTGTTTVPGGGEEDHSLTFMHLDDFMPTGYLTEIENAFRAWELVSGVAFTQVADDGVPFNASPTTGHGHIRLGGAAFGSVNGGVLAHGFFPPVNGSTAAGDIHFDIDDSWKIGFGGAGFDVFTVASHEIGHALGLAHTAVPLSLMNANYSEAFLGPQSDDIAGAISLYGTPSIVVPEPTHLMVFGCVVVFLMSRTRRV